MRFRPRAILVVLHGSVGDVTRALPLANIIRRGFPEATLAWAVEPAVLPLLKYHPAVDEVIVFDRTQWWRTLWSFLHQIRARRFDLVLDLQRHLKSGLISRWSGAPNRIGFHRDDCKEFNWIFNNQFIVATGNTVSKLNHYLKFAEYLGLEPQPIEWRIRVSEADKAAVDQLLAGVGEFAALFVGSRWQSKQWFPYQVALCAEEIRRRYGLEGVLLGGKADAALAQEAEEIHGARLINLVGLTSLGQAADIIARAKVAVGPDTGLMHIAVAMGTPVISLWGATSPDRSGPYDFSQFVVQGQAACSPCYLKRCPIGRVCMRSINMDEVSAKVGLALLSEHRPTEVQAAPS